MTGVVQSLNQDPLKLLAKESAMTSVDPKASLASASSLLPIGFTTVFDYLFLLKEACLALHVAGAGGIAFLAAAVSDFYVPEKEMATNKIQSQAHDGLTVQLRNVPKLLGAVRVWAPEAFVVSFKLETNQNILLAKAAGALSKYRVDAVCSNQLQTIRDLVTIIWKDPCASEVRVLAEHIGGDEDEEIPVRGVLSQVVHRGTAAAIDPALVDAIASMHDKRRATGAAAGAGDTSSGEPPQKKGRMENAV